ncbi:MAG: hypothetical protein HFE59_03995 [Clostridiales bacterium]|nr:hypothetical protein [Clostridiales bacterium]
MFNTVGSYLPQTNTNLYSNPFYNNNSQRTNNVSADGNLKSGQVEKTECQTCKNRKYVDGSNEADVSFKTPSHISPSMSASAVASHESEHVSNAVAEGEKKGNKLLSVSVTLETSVCPECGRTYVSGGKTETLMLKGSEEQDKPENPYEAGRNLVMRFLAQGQNINVAV